MGQAKNRGSLEERVKNAKKFRKEAILSELKKIVEGHYQHVPDQFSHRQNYLDGCVIPELILSKVSLSISYPFNLIRDKFPFAI